MTVLYAPCPGGQRKFHVLYDEQTKLYWLLSTQATDSMIRPERMPANICRRSRENSSVLAAPPKSHDFGYDTRELGTSHYADEMKDIQENTNMKDHSDNVNLPRPYRRRFVQASTAAVATLAAGRSFGTEERLAVSSATTNAGRRWPSELTVHNDPVSGAAVRQLTNYRAHSNHSYFAYWMADGEHIGYHGSNAKGGLFGSICYDNTDHVESPFSGHCWHFHSHLLDLVVGDGDAQNPYLLAWRFRDGAFQGPKVLAWHRGSFHTQQVHVHPCVHAQGTKVLYTADPQGYGQVFIVDVPDWDALPDRSGVKKG